VEGKPLKKRVLSYFLFFSFYSIKKKPLFSFSSQFLVTNKLVQPFESIVKGQYGKVFECVGNMGQ